MGQEEPSQGYRATAFALFSAYKQGGFGGEVMETAPSSFHLADPQALVACACPWPVLRPGPYPPPTVIS